jgi:hypothetical protein
MPPAAVRRSYERHLDLILAEEMNCNMSFARFVFERAIGTDRLPVGDPVEVVVRISHDDDLGNDEGVTGENDVFAEARWNPSWRARALLEDKLDAGLQQNQIGRYLRRAELHAAAKGISAAGAVIVAPANYLTARAAELNGISQLTIDEIADWLRDNAQSAGPELAARLRWRADRLARLIDGRRLFTPDYPPMVAARDRIIDRLALLAPTVVAWPASMRTASSGWLEFRRPSAITYKVVHGIIDIYLRDVWPGDQAEQRRVHSSGPWPTDFAPAADTKGNLVLRSVVRPPGAPDGMRPIEAVDEPELDRGAEACAAAAAWLLEVRSDW